MTAPTAFPLAWPAGWPRTTTREAGSYRTSLAGALANLTRELRALAGPAAAASLVLSSNVTLGQDGPQDTGVVAYFSFGGEQVAIPCDRWRKVEHNVQAIALTIEAMRAMERHGARHMIKAMFRGFAALPSPAPDWRAVLGHPKTRAEAIAAYLARARTAHPDAGGSTSAMQALNAARAAALAELPE